MCIYIYVHICKYMHICRYIRVRTTRRSFFHLKKSFRFSFGPCELFVLGYSKFLLLDLDKAETGPNP